MIWLRNYSFNPVAREGPEGIANLIMMNCLRVRSRHATWTGSVCLPELVAWTIITSAIMVPETGELCPFSATSLVLIHL